MTSSVRPETPLDLTGRTHRPLMSPGRTAPFDVVFLDRDGTLNELLPGYRTAADFTLLPRAADAVAALARAGCLLVLVTNQRGLATGALSWDEVAEVNGVLLDAVRERGGRLDDVRLCPHQSAACGCRKPMPGLLEEFFSDNPHLGRDRCVMVGDSDTDDGAAQAAGIRFVLCDPSRGLAEVVDSLLSPQKGTIPSHS